VSRMRRGEISLADAPAVVSDVLELCARARDASGGWFDPWSSPDGVDPTGLVKGWAAEQALLRLSLVPGVTGVMVNAGGDVACFGRPGPDREWRVGIRSPSDPGTVIATFDGAPAVATSGTYERGAHIYRPSGWSEEQVVVASATVVGPELWMADALATGLAAGGPEALAFIDAMADYHGLLVHAHGEIESTTGCPLDLVGTPAP